MTQKTTIYILVKAVMVKTYSLVGERNAYKNLVQKHLEKYPLGKLRRSCEDKIKMILVG
jgi:hypothetical protein